MSISKVTLVRQSQMYLAFVERVCDLVGENACREAGYEFLDAGDVRCPEDVVVDEGVIAVEGELI
jgi:hypothetical protein